MKKSAIYTRTGDSGETSLFGGKRVKKNSPRIKTIGAVDELNACLGVCVNSASDTTKKILLEVQSDLFMIGASLANPSFQSNKTLAAKVIGFESLIDQLDSKLPELHNFILPSGTPPAAQLHLARSICRRAEREIVELLEGEELEPQIRIYLNRLSDLLFVLARLENDLGKKDVIWKPE